MSSAKVLRSMFCVCVPGPRSKASVDGSGSEGER